MKSRLFLVTFLLVLWGGVTFGQGRGTEKRITASFSGIPLSEAIGTIEKTSGYTFFYDAKKTDLTQKVSLSARNMPIAEAISSMLKTTNLGFEIANMQVVLFLKEKKPAAPQSKEIDATGKVTDHEGNRGHRRHGDRQPRHHDRERRTLLHPRTPGCIPHLLLPGL